MKLFGYSFFKKIGVEKRELVQVEVEKSDLGLVDVENVEKRDFSLNSSALFDLLTGKFNSAGVDVNETRILGISAFWAAVRIISHCLAGLDAHVCKHEVRGFSKQPLHPVSRMLNYRISPNCTRFDFFSSLIANAVLGNGFAKIHRDFETFRPISLEILPKQCVEVIQQSDGSLVYQVGSYAGQSRSEMLHSWEVLHIKGLSFDSLAGKDVIDAHHDTFGSTLAAKQYLSNYFEKGAHPSGVLTYKGNLDSNEREKLGEKVDKKYGSMKNSGKTMVLDNAQTFHVLQNNPNDAAVIPFQTFIVSEISRITGVPIHLLADLSRSTNNNIEQQSIEFVSFCLLPWARRVEEEINKKLFYESEIGEFYYKFDFSSLLQADSAAESENARTGIQNGYLTPNEVRERRGLPPIDDADKLLIQLNMTTLENAQLSQVQPSLPVPPS